MHAKTQKEKKLAHHRNGKQRKLLTKIYKLKDACTKDIQR
jgi:hypothetical protein